MLCGLVQEPDYTYFVTHILNLSSHSLQIVPLLTKHLCFLLVSPLNIIVFILFSLIDSRANIKVVSSKLCV